MCSNVGHLASASSIRAVRDAVEKGTPTAQRRLSTSMQAHVDQAWLYKDKVDGKAGMQTRSALGATRGQQHQGGLLADRRGAGHMQSKSAAGRN